MDVEFGMNKNTLDVLVESNNRHTGEDLGNSIPYIDLNLLTSNYKKLSYRIMKFLVNSEKVRKGQDGFKNYKMKDGSILNYRLASDVFKFDGEEKELLSEDRYGHCYLRSIQTAPFIKDSNILFGSTKIGDYQRMHSVIEFSLKDRLCVFDWTQNLVMPKEQYIKLFDFKISNSIKGSDIKRIVYLSSKYGLHMASSIVLAFGQEIEDDIKKRIKIK